MFACSAYGKHYALRSMAASFRHREYVDDFFIARYVIPIIEDALSKLKQHLALIGLKEKNFLYIKIIKNNDGKQLFQTSYIEKLLRKYNLENFNPARTPILPNARPRRI